MTNIIFGLGNVKSGNDSFIYVNLTKGPATLFGAPEEQQTKPTVETLYKELPYGNLQDYLRGNDIKKFSSNEEHLIAEIKQRRLNTDNELTNEKILTELNGMFPFKISRSQLERFINKHKAELARNHTLSIETKMAIVERFEKGDTAEKISYDFHLIKTITPSQLGNMRRNVEAYRLRNSSQLSQENTPPPDTQSVGSDGRIKRARSLSDFEAPDLIILNKLKNALSRDLQNVPDPTSEEYAKIKADRNFVSTFIDEIDIEVGAGLRKSKERIDEFLRIAKLPSPDTHFTLAEKTETLRIVGKMSSGKKPRPDSGGDHHEWDGRGASNPTQ